MASNPDAILSSLSDAGVDFIVVGGFAAVLLGVPVFTHDVDIVHCRTEANVDALLEWLLQHAAYNRLDLANRKLPPSRDALLGAGHSNLHTVPFEGDGTSLLVLDLPRLIQAKSNANRPKDPRQRRSGPSSTTSLRTPTG